MADEEMTMVERVARAIEANKPMSDWPTKEEVNKQARSAIAAMREPTQAMILAGEATEDACSMGFARPEWVFPDMIDAALKETA